MKPRPSNMLILFSIVHLATSKQWNSDEEMEKYPYLKQEKFHQSRPYGSAPSPWIDGPNEERYQFNIGHQSWLAAREHCLTQNSDLVTIDDQEELDWILNHYQPVYKHLRERQIQVGLMIDGYDTMREWKWVNGQQLNRTLLPWINGEPYDHTDGRERCALLGVNMRRLDDIDCDLPASEVRLFRFICERTKDAHLKHEKATNPLMKKLEELLNFFGINPAQNQAQNLSTTAPETEDYWDKVFQEEKAKKEAAEAKNATTIETMASTSTNEPKTEASEAPTTPTEMLGDPSFEATSNLPIEGPSIGEPLETSHSEAVESVPSSTLAQKTSTVEPTTSEPEQDVNQILSKHDLSEEQKEGLQKLIDLASSKSSLELQATGEIVEKPLPNVVNLETAAEVIVVPEEIKNSTSSIENERSYHILAVPENDPLSTEVPEKSSEATESPESTPIEVQPSSLVSESGEASEAPDDQKTTTLEPKTGQELSEKPIELTIDGPLTAELLKEEETKQKSIKFDEKESNMLAIEGPFEDEPKSDDASTNTALKSAETTEKFDETTETEATTQTPTDSTSISSHENLEKTEKSTSEPIDSTKFGIQPIFMEADASKNTEKPETIQEMTPEIRLSSTEKLPMVPAELVIKEHLEKLDKESEVEKDKFTFAPVLPKQDPLQNLAENLEQMAVNPADLVNPAELENKMQHLERIVSAVQKMIEPLDAPKNETNVLDDKLSDGFKNASLEENIDEKNKEEVDKEDVVLSLERDFDDAETTPNPDKFIPLPHGPLETHCGSDESEDPEDQKAEKIEKFLLTLRKFLDRASTKDLKQLVDDSKTQNKPLLQKLDEAVNMSMLSELKKIEELERLRHKGGDISKIEKHLEDKSDEAEHLRNSIEENIVQDFRKSGELPEKDQIENHLKKVDLHSETTTLEAPKNASEEGYEYKVVIDLKDYVKDQNSTHPELIDFGNLTSTTPESLGDEPRIPQNSHANLGRHNRLIFEATEQPLVDERTTKTTRKLPEDSTSTSADVSTLEVQNSAINLAEPSSTPPESIRLPDGLQIGDGVSLQPENEDSTVSEPENRQISKILIDEVKKSNDPYAKLYKNLSSEAKKDAKNSKEEDQKLVIAEELKSTEHEVKEKPLEDEINSIKTTEKESKVQETTANSNIVQDETIKNAPKKGMEPIFIDTTGKPIENLSPERTTVAEDLHSSQKLTSQEATTRPEASKTSPSPPDSLKSSETSEKSTSINKTTLSDASFSTINPEKDQETTKIIETSSTSELAPFKIESSSESNESSTEKSTSDTLSSVYTSREKLLVERPPRKLTKDLIPPTERPEDEPNSREKHGKLTKDLIPPTQNPEELSKLQQEWPYMEKTVVIEELPMNFSKSEEKKETSKEVHKIEPKLRADRVQGMRPLTSEELGLQETEYSSAKNALPQSEETSTPSSSFPQIDLSSLTPEKLKELEAQQKEVDERNKLEAAKVNSAYDEFNMRNNLEQLINKVKQGENDARKPLGEIPSSKEKEDTLIKLKKVFDDIGKNFQKLLEGKLP